MLIILHRQLENDMRRMYDEVYTELSKRINISILKTARGLISVRPDIKIKFLSGYKDKLDGLRPDYYNTDMHSVDLYFERSAWGDNGRYVSIMEIYSIIEGYIKRCEAKSLENRSLKMMHNSIYGYKGGFMHKQFVSKDDIRNSIKKVIFSGPATIVLWNDGTKTVVKLSGHDGELTEELRWSGLSMCISKKVFESNKDFKKSFKKWCCIKEG